jgi:CheY-like chemotaxis protein
MLFMTQAATPYQNVLLVDDSEVDQLIARKVMQISGFAKDIVVRSSGQSALDFLVVTQREKSKPLPQIIFLDLNMPVLDGLSFLQIFETLPDEVKDTCKIVVLSSSDNKDDLRKVIGSAYVSKVLTKPLTIDSLATLDV